MNKATLLGAGAIATVIATAGLMGGGVASAAPDFSGKTYGEAAEQIQSWGATAVIETVVGDQLPTDQCLVSNTKKSSFLDSSGRQSGSAYLLSLNCNGILAQNGKAGGSAATPEGRKMAKQLRALQWVNEDPTRCDGAEWCKTLCEKYADKCSAELAQYVAGIS